MNIGILTLYGLDNYGSVLQAYALQMTLEKLEYKSEIIAYSVDQTPSILFGYGISSLKMQGFSSTLRSMSGFISKFFSEKLGAILRCDTHCVPNCDLFSDFRLKYLRITHQIYYPKILKKTPPEYDAYISGSDNVWKMADAFGISDGGARFYLDFVPENKKRISYAPSMGDPHIHPRHQKRLTQLLSHIQYLSVRGKTTAAALSELTGRNIVSVCDPTLLLTPDDWNVLITAPSKVSESYVLVYVIHPEPIDSPAYLFAEAIADRMQFQVKYIGYHFEKGKPVYTTVSISEFLESFKYASLIVTNTFHGTMFSIIFRRNFYVFKPKQGPTRIVDVLDEVGLSQRLVTSVDEANTLEPYIDYSQIEERIQKFRNDSLSWLKNALQENGGCS